MNFCIACNDKHEKEELGKNGIVKVEVEPSAYAEEYKKASKFLEEDKIDSAIEIYQKLSKIEEDKLKTHAYVGMGSSYCLLQDYKNAIINYEIARKMDESNSNSYWGLAITYDKINQIDSAKIYAKKFLELEPDSKSKGLMKEILNK